MTGVHKFVECWPPLHPSPSLPFTSEAGRLRIWAWRSSPLPGSGLGKARHTMGAAMSPYCHVCCWVSLWNSALGSLILLPTNCDVPHHQCGDWWCLEWCVLSGGLRLPVYSEKSSGETPVRFGCKCYWVNLGEMIQLFLFILFVTCLCCSGRFHFSI